MTETPADDRIAGGGRYALGALHGRSALSLLWRPDHLLSRVLRRPRV